MGHRMLRSPSIPPSVAIVSASSKCKDQNSQCITAGKAHRIVGAMPTIRTSKSSSPTIVTFPLPLIVLFCPTTGFRVCVSLLLEAVLTNNAIVTGNSISKQCAMQAGSCLHMTASRCYHHHVSLLGLANFQAKCGLHSSSCNRHLHSPKLPHFADKGRAVLTSTQHMADR